MELTKRSQSRAEATSRVSGCLRAQMHQAAFPGWRPSLSRMPTVTVCSCASTTVAIEFSSITQKSTTQETSAVVLSAITDSVAAGDSGHPREISAGQTLPSKTFRNNLLSVWRIPLYDLGVTDLCPRLRVPRSYFFLPSPRILHDASCGSEYLARNVFRRIIIPSALEDSQ
jgi:hypothetical protein